jgi:hypothetical protein
MKMHITTLKRGFHGGILPARPGMLPSPNNQKTGYIRKPGKKEIP